MKHDNRFIFRRTIFVLMTLIVGVLYMSSLVVAESIIINTGYNNKPGIVSGQPDPVFSWNYTGNFSDPRYNAYTYGDPTRDFGATHDCHMGGGD